MQITATCGYSRGKTGFESGGHLCQHLLSHTLMVTINTHMYQDLRDFVTPTALASPSEYPDPPVLSQLTRSSSLSLQDTWKVQRAEAELRKCLGKDSTEPLLKSKQLLNANIFQEVTSVQHDVAKKNSWFTWEIQFQCYDLFVGFSDNCQCT